MKKKSGAKKQEAAKRLPAKTNQQKKAIPSKKAIIADKTDGAKKTKPQKSNPPLIKPLSPAVQKATFRHVGLGRGLDALISAKAAATAQQNMQAARKEIVSSIKESQVSAAPTGKGTAPTAGGKLPDGEEFLQVKTSLIHRSPWQPRGTFNQESLKELAETIKTHGLIQALTCRRIPASKGGGFELISGERRLRAAIDAGLEEVPVRVVKVSDREAAEMGVIENVQRDDLNAIEEAEGYHTLVEQFKLTQQEVADRVGKGRASIAHAMRLLELPDEVKQLVAAGQLSVGHAKVLLSLTNETEQVLLARKCVLTGQTVRALERAIARRDEEKTSIGTQKPDMPESHTRFLLDKLHGFFGAPVRLKPSATFANGKKARGTLEIDFIDNDDLSRILELLGISAD
jgi:ParB family chromosome partitioning protein